MPFHGYGQSKGVAENTKRLNRSRNMNNDGSYDESPQTTTKLHKESGPSKSYLEQKQNEGYPECLVLGNHVDSGPIDLSKVGTRTERGTYYFGQPKKIINVPTTTSLSSVPPITTPLLAPALRAKHSGCDEVQVRLIDVADGVSKVKSNRHHGDLKDEFRVLVSPIKKNNEIGQDILNISNGGEKMVTELSRRSSGDPVGSPGSFTYYDFDNIEGASSTDGAYQHQGIEPQSPTDTTLPFGNYSDDSNAWSSRGIISPPSSGDSAVDSSSRETKKVAGPRNPSLHVLPWNVSPSYQTSILTTQPAAASLSEPRRLFASYKVEDYPPLL